MIESLRGKEIFSLTFLSFFLLPGVFKENAYASGQTPISAYLVLKDGLPRRSVDERTLNLVKSLIGVSLDCTFGIAKNEATTITTIDTRL